MNETIRQALLYGRAVLFLGAGASITSTDSQGRALPLAGDIAVELAKAAGLRYDGEELKVVYAAAKNRLGNQIQSILESRLKHCTPSVAYNTIASFPVARVYTINIDDAFDKALHRNSKQRVNIHNRYSKLKDSSQIYKDIDYIKLNGSIDRPEDGFVFSPKEYAHSTGTNPWYDELARDYVQNTFIFIGTKLDEPTFYHHVERHINATDSHRPTAFLITPSLSEIRKEALLSEFSIEHIPGTVDSFADWITRTFKPIPTYSEIAINRNPVLKQYTGSSKHATEQAITTLEKLTPVGRSNFTLLPRPVKGKIRDFYQGFKPTWRDIIDDIPAELTSTTEFTDFIKDKAAGGCKLIVAFGPAGSGKSTLLMQSALRIADTEITPVYFAAQYIDNIKDAIRLLELSANGQYYIFIDRLDACCDDIKWILENKKVTHGTFVCCESQKVWYERTKAKVGYYCSTYQLSTINKNDAVAILGKLEQHGPWTRLKQLSPQTRVHEMLNKSKRQLLIGLLETTLGKGFEEIIENDYQQFADDEDKIFFTIIGLATIHRTSLQLSYAISAFSAAGYSRDLSNYLQKFSGIIHNDGLRIVTRHPVYVRHLFDSVISSEILYKSILALLSAYTEYEAPIIKHVNKPEATLFKSLINHNFLYHILRGDKNLVLSVYHSFEKHFEIDGLYWLQYGLSLRDFDDQIDSYSKLQIAYEAHPHPQTEHALAQQELILADRVNDKEQAYKLLSSAKDKLIGLDKRIVSDDTYPIVTLSEGHTSLAVKYDGVDAAILIAKSYANTLAKRTKLLENDGRFKTAWLKLTTFVTTGVWNEGQAE